MMLEEIRLLYAYNGWANQRLLEAASSLTQEQFTRDLGSSFGSVRDTLGHILGAEWLWLERWHGRSPTAMPASEQFTTLASLRARWAEVSQQLEQFIAQLAAEDLEQIHHYRTTDGKPYAQPLWQMLQHLVNHGSYHRGQVTTLLRQLGAQPIATDLILFYRQRAAQA